MFILFDHQIIASQKFGGISKYFFELVLNLQKNNLAKIKLPFIHIYNEYIYQQFNKIFPSKTHLYGNLKNLQKKSFLVKGIELLKRKFISYANKRNSIKELVGQKFDLFHPTYYDPYFIKHLKDKPFILTIYDMIHEIYPQYFDLKDKTKENKLLLAQKAKKIIAISENTKKDIIKYLHIPPEKITVIHLANSPTKERENISIPSQYILYVGGRGRYKNFTTFLVSFSEAAKKNPNLHLICVSQISFSSIEFALIKNLGLQNNCILIPANDRQLRFLYENALAFIYPSLYEGFGLPILEAFSANCPVLVSNTSCFPEIAGSAAIYFDPRDIPSITSALEQIVTDKSLRQNLIKEGQKQLTKFSWEKTARQTAELYKKCLKD